MIMINLFLPRASHATAADMAQFEAELTAPESAIKPPSVRCSFPHIAYHTSSPFVLFNPQSEGARLELFRFRFRTVDDTTWV
jgi:hypothetical protein